MKEKRGKLIVLEGTDGSGKKTQTKLLIERLQKEGYRIATISFPQYGEKSAGPVEEWLVGKYGDIKNVDPRVVSIFFAVDRFDAARTIRSALDKGMITVLDRYVDSNAGHQGGKIKNEKERKVFFRWLYDMEYRIFGIPRPDIVLVLHIPIDFTQKLVRQRQQKLRFPGTLEHDTDREYQKNSERSYLVLVKQSPETHRMVECVSGEKLLAPRVIHEKIWKIIKPALL
ncbi:MAG: hypothetical protein A3C07_00935 [Candidatus Sungbacteria bacterium RIFCSPHIGHO2_02_FULL_47_11]|uniref:Thymidylate kinase n=1 Tax=Candidatus Sungbacteria bacterium RIFCSPHIGHO2_02_FULL_47_11 TaxID=1802270 RepID=A0A1G2KQS4_9BACT|nr:MAG: hypothetical protein A3C07_00935 [Candidatus Sungbacteria bacterium RIFCSPHIGHO2_02_FULL_47_11]